MVASAHTAKSLLSYDYTTCGRDQDGQGIFKDALKHIHSAIVEPGTILNNDSRDDLCRSLLWYARCRGDVRVVQQVMDNVQTVLEMRGVAKQEPFVGLSKRHVISSHSIAGTVVGAAAVLLCSSWQLVLVLIYVLVAGLFLLFRFK